MNTKRWTFGQHGGFYECARLWPYALIVGMLVGADCVQAQTWIGGGDRTWTQPDSVHFSPEYTSGSTATFTATGAGTVTNDVGGVTPGAIVVNAGTYTFRGGSIGGTGSLTIEGTGNVTLISANSFSGGIFLNAGKLYLNTGSTSASLGDPANVVTFTGNSEFNVQAVNQTLSQGFVVNEGVTAKFYGNADRKVYINNSLTGSGSVNIESSGNNFEVFFYSTNNTLSGNISVGSGGGSHFLHMDSLVDTPGRRLTLGSGSRVGTFSYGIRAVVPLALSNRRIGMYGSTGGGVFNNNATNVNCTVTVNTDLEIISAGNKTFTLGGSNTGTNTFAGAITNGAGSVISLIKANAGKWILSGNNTFSGTTTVSDGTLVLAGSKCLSDTNYLSIASNKKVQLEAGVKEKVGILILNNATQLEGIWGATGNAAAEYTSAYLLGTGLLYVNRDPPLPPPPGTLMYIK